MGSTEGGQSELREATTRELQCGAGGNRERGRRRVNSTPSRRVSSPLALGSGLRDARVGLNQPNARQRVASERRSQATANTAAGSETSRPLAGAMDVFRCLRTNATSE